MRAFFSLRSLVGALLFMILVGETAVPQFNHLYSIAGVFLYLMYLIMFNLYESLIIRYRLVNAQVVLLTFIVYAVIITGFLHKEIADFVTIGNYFFTTMIRIQSSMFTVYALYLLNQWLPRRESQVLPVTTNLIVAAVFIAGMSMTGQFGLPYVVYTVVVAPLYTLLFIVLSLLAWWYLKNYRVSPVRFRSHLFTAVALIFTALALIPSLTGFWVLLISMPLMTIYFWRFKSFRNGIA